MRSDDLVGLKTVKREQCQFTKYGFEKPDFECEILGSDEIGFVGMVNNYFKYWHSDGRCFKILNGDEEYPQYNLKPLKKEWYEDIDELTLIFWSSKHDKFNEENPMLVDNYILFNNTTPRLENKKTHSYINIQEVNCRLATKREVLSLYKETK